MTLKELFDKAVLREILDGLKTTFKHLWVKPVTFQYPHEKRAIPDAHRGALCLLRYDDGKARSPAARAQRKLPRLLLWPAPSPARSLRPTPWHSLSRPCPKGD